VLGEAGQDYASPKKTEGAVSEILLILIAAIVLLISRGSLRLAGYCRNAMSYRSSASFRTTPEKTLFP